jgi:hypothetical protein
MKQSRDDVTTILAWTPLREEIYHSFHPSPEGKSIETPYGQIKVVQEQEFRVVIDLLLAQLLRSLLSKVQASCSPGAAQTTGGPPESSLEVGPKPRSGQLRNGAEP